MPARRPSLFVLNALLWCWWPSRSLGVGCDMRQEGGGDEAKFSPEIVPDRLQCSFHRSLIFRVRGRYSCDTSFQ